MRYTAMYRPPLHGARVWFNTLGPGTELLNDGSNAEYFAAFESTFNCTMQWHPDNGLPIGIEFTDEKYYTMFMLRWS